MRPVWKYTIPLSFERSGKMLGTLNFETWPGPPLRPSRVRLLRQTHSDIIRGPHDAGSEGDGFFLQGAGNLKALKNGLCLGIKTADCLPVLLLGERGPAFLHAGWRGIKQGIATRPEIIDLKIRYLIIGPSISVANYQVTPDFRANFPHSQAFDSLGDRLFFDLQKELIDRCLLAHPLLKARNCAYSEVCTYACSELNSYRRDQTKRRNYNILFLNLHN